LKACLGIQPLHFTGILHQQEQRHVEVEKKTKQQKKPFPLFILYFPKYQKGVDRSQPKFQHCFVLDANHLFHQLSPSRSQTRLPFQSHEEIGENYHGQHKEVQIRSESKSSLKTYIYSFSKALSTDTTVHKTTNKKARERHRATLLSPPQKLVLFLSA